MALTNDQITAQNFKDFYGQIRPYLNGTAHGGFTPIGTVISVMGKQAPHNYLVCDGTVYNIADYPELAAYFAGQFEASNFFGGDGVTTFAVPDLRGEFLRGTGTNSHTNQGNGAEVGIHQDGTQHAVIVGGYSGGNAKKIEVRGVPDGGGNMAAINTDVLLPGSVLAGSKIVSTANTGTIGDLTSTANSRYASRPTNTSVLYCIATKNIFMDAGCNYSTDELVIGTWIDGKPIYQKTIQNITFPSSITDGSETQKEYLLSDYGIQNANVILNYQCYGINMAPYMWIRDNILLFRKVQAGGTPGTATRTIQVVSNSHSDENRNISALTLQYTKTTD